MKTTVLVFGFAGKDLAALKGVCARQGVRLRRVEPAEYGRTLGCFFGPSAAAPAQPAGEASVGKMLLLAGFAPRQMEAFLSALRLARVGDCPKAVLTEHNAAWTAPALYRELCRERDAMGG